MPTIDEEILLLRAHHVVTADNWPHIVAFFRAALAAEGGESAELPVLVTEYNPEYARDPAREAAGADAAELAWDLIDSNLGVELSHRVVNWAAEYVDRVYEATLPYDKRRQLRQRTEEFALPIRPATGRKMKAADED